MKICGIQKLSLQDFPEKLSAIVFTGGCNLRCPFCHNAALALGTEQTEVMTEDELLEFLEKRKGRLEGVCISGGEPTLQPDLEDFIKKIRASGYAVKLDTNGTNPEILARLTDNGLLDYVAMDIKNSRAKYVATCGMENMNFGNIEKSIDILMQNRVPYEFRTTVVGELHTVEDIQDIALRIKGAPRYYLQTFVDSGGLIAQNLHAADAETMLKMKNAALRYVKNTKIRGE